MNAAVLHTFGQPPRYSQFPEPVAGEGEVIVRVCAASLKPVDRQMAAGSHYAKARQLPAVCGTDGVGTLEDGSRVFFGVTRAPYGSMAQLAVASRAFCFPVPDGLDDETAAALPNPGVSAWLSLSFRARLEPGESVLILGATGVTGRLAVKIAKLLGAGRVVAAGRNAEALGHLYELGADALVRLDIPEQEIGDALASAAGQSGIQVVIDYVWGRPAELILGALARKGFAAIGAETRWVQVGEGAGPTISLPAAVLRSSAISILGTAGIPPREKMVDALQRVMGHAAAGDLRVDTERIALADVEQAWQSESRGRRWVVIP